MSACRNPECRDKYTPGIIASGKGSKMAPVVGATMRWGWVNCRACNPKDKDPPYQHVSRSPAEIQERARLADNKAAYVHQEVPKRSNLAAIAANTTAPAASPVSSDATHRMDRLLDKIEKLTDQVTTLVDENRTLRAQLEVNNHASPVIRRRKKKEGNDVEVSSKGKRSLS